MRFGNKFYYMMIGLGLIFLVLLGTLIAMIVKDDNEALEISMPTEEFIYDDKENYGENLMISSELETKIESVFYEIGAFSEIWNRISAFFAKNYPDHSTFALVKGSYRESRSEVGLRVRLGMVSDEGAVVWLEIEGADYDLGESKIKLLNNDNELLYEDTIKWSDVLEIGG